MMEKPKYYTPEEAEGLLASFSNSLTEHRDLIVADRSLGLSGIVCFSESIPFDGGDIIELETWVKEYVWVYFSEQHVTNVKFFIRPEWCEADNCFTTVGSWLWSYNHLYDLSGWRFESKRVTEPARLLLPVIDRFLFRAACVAKVVIFQKLLFDSVMAIRPGQPEPGSWYNPPKLFPPIV